MTTMMTVPQMTLMLLGTVVGLGATLVWMFWELQKPSQLPRGRDRFERRLTNVCCKLRARLNAACVQVPSDSLASSAPVTVS